MRQHRSIHTHKSRNIFIGEIDFVVIFCDDLVIQQDDQYNGGNMQTEKNQTTREKTNDARAVSRVGLIDTETGEVLDGGKMIYVAPKLRIKGFFMADQKGFEELA